MGRRNDSTISAGNTHRIQYRATSVAAGLQQQRQRGNAVSGASLGSQVRPCRRPGAQAALPTRGPLRPTSSDTAASPAGARREESRAHPGVACSRANHRAPTPGHLSLPTRPGNPPPALRFAACGESTEFSNYLELHRAAITPDARHFPIPAPAVGGRRNVKYIQT